MKQEATEPARQREFEPHLVEQLFELAEAAAAARAEREESEVHRDSAIRLEDRVRVLGGRSWLQRELEIGPVTVSLNDGRLATITKQGSTQPPQPPRITISELVRGSDDG